MKKTVCIIMCLAILVTLTGCFTYESKLGQFLKGFSDPLSEDILEGAWLSEDELNSIYFNSVSQFEFTAYDKSGNIQTSLKGNYSISAEGTLTLSFSQSNDFFREQTKIFYVKGQLIIESQQGDIVFNKQ